MEPLFYLNELKILNLFGTLNYFLEKAGEHLLDQNYFAFTGDSALETLGTLVHLEL